MRLVLHHIYTFTVTLLFCDSALIAAHLLNQTVKKSYSLSPMSSAFEIYFLVHTMLKTPEEEEALSKQRLVHVACLFLPHCITVMLCYIAYTIIF